jgi:polyhydroxybutyrate depolymerase
MRTPSPLIASLLVAIALGAIGCGSPATSVSQESPVASSTVSSASPSPAGAIAPSPSSASPSAPAGSDVSGTITSGKIERTYLLHLPPASTRLQPTPIVVAFHGWPMTAVKLADVTHLSAVANEHGFAVLYPQGYGDSWSVPGGLPTPAQQAGVDDVAFVRALLDSVGPQYHLETSRAVATGISNGGHLVQTLGCQLADHLVGIVPVAAPLKIGNSSKCSPSRSLSVLEIVGTFDQKAATFPDTLSFWEHADKCPGVPVGSSLSDAAVDQTTVTISSFIDCRGGTEVTGYLVNGGGHAWPGGKPLGGTDEVGVTTRQFDASELIWDFLSRHR